MTEENNEQSQGEQAPAQQSGGGRKKPVEMISSNEYNNLKSEFDKSSKAFQQLQQEHNALKESQAKYEGIDPEDYRKMKSDLRDAKVKNAGKKPEEIEALIEETTSELRNEYGKYKETSESQISSLKSELKSLKVTQVAMSELPFECVPDCKDIIQSIMEKSLDLDENGKIVVLGDDGKPRYSKSNPSQLMTKDEFYKEVFDARPSLFKPTGVTQGGMPRNGQANSKGSSITDGVDQQRYSTDMNYRNSFDRSTRVKLDKQFKL